jgi:hypothetical protein
MDASGQLGCELADRLDRECASKFGDFPPQGRAQWRDIA